MTQDAKSQRRATLKRLRKQVAEQAAQIEQLQTAHAMDQGLLNDMSRQLGEMRHTYKRIIDIVGPYSILCERPTTLDTLIDAQQARVSRRFSYAMPPRLQNDYFYNASIQDHSNQHFQQAIIELLEVQAVQDAISHCVHVKIRLSDASVMYGISIDALQSMPRDVLIKDMERKIAPCLVEALERLSIRKAPEEYRLASS